MPLFLFFSLAGIVLVRYLPSYSSGLLMAAARPRVLQRLIYVRLPNDDSSSGLGSPTVSVSCLTTASIDLSAVDGQ